MSPRNQAHRTAEALTVANERTCNWEQEQDYPVFYPACQEGREEFNLTPGLDLWPFCPWCGGRVSVVHTDDTAAEQKHG
jgi:hypothetical protein